MEVDLQSGDKMGTVISKIRIVPAEDDASPETPIQIETDEYSGSEEATPIPNECDGDTVDKANPQSPTVSAEMYKRRVYAKLVVTKPMCIHIPATVIEHAQKEPESLVEKNRRRKDTGTNPSQTLSTAMTTQTEWDLWGEQLPNWRVVVIFKVIF